MRINLRKVDKQAASFDVAQDAELVQIGYSILKKPRPKSAGAFY